MNIYQNRRKYKIAILGLAVLISVMSLAYTNYLVDQLSAEEKKRVELYAEATRRFAQTTNLNEDLTFVSEVITRNKTIPVILTDENDSIISHVNLNEERAKNHNFLLKKLEHMKETHEFIPIDILNGKIKRRVYYDDSTLLNMLFWFPFVQLGVFGIFVVVAYWAFSSSRNAEQNQVWVGMSKETAHQLGTPISSLMAWVELMRVERKNEEYTEEMQKDLDRLQTIVDRFSKIGARPLLNDVNFHEVLQDAVNYMKRRSSPQIKFTYQPNDTANLNVPLNKALFTWVIENVIRNAVDAMAGKGQISINSFTQKNLVFVDITDTGKGIPRSQVKTIFRPGVTSKKRGWGLGLSLAYRIIAEYHKGNIFVKWSEPGKGTTFRIVLNKEVEA